MELLKEEGWVIVVVGAGVREKRDSGTGLTNFKQALVTSVRISTAADPHRDLRPRSQRPALVARSSAVGVALENSSRRTSPSGDSGSLELRSDEKLCGQRSEPATIPDLAAPPGSGLLRHA